MEIDREWDIIFLGHSVRNIKDFDIVYNKELTPIVQKWNRNKSFQNSIGGSFSYLISKKVLRNF